MQNSCQGLSWKVDQVFDCRVLGARIRDQERKMITMGSETGHVSHDITPIHKVLACWVYSYWLKY